MRSVARDVRPRVPLRSRLGLVALGVAGAAPAAAQDVDLSEYVDYRVGGEVAAPREGLTDVDMDGVIRIEWDEAGLARALGVQAGFVDAEDPLLGRLEFLGTVGSQFHRVQSLLLETKTAYARWQGAASRGIDEAEARREFDDVNGRFAGAALAALVAVDTSRVIDRPLRDRLNDALLGGSFDSVAAVLGRFAAREGMRLDTLLESRLASSNVRVFMQGWIRSAGAERRVHLPGYDDLESGVPSPFPRFQFAPSERLRRELRAAETAGSLLRNTDTLAAEISAAWEALGEELRTLRQSLDLERLASGLDSVAGAAGLPDGGLPQTLVAPLGEVRSLLGVLTDPPSVEVAGDAELLLDLADRLAGHVGRILTAASRAQTAFPRLADALAAEAAGAAEPELAGLLRTAGRALGERPEIRALLDRIGEVTAAVGVSARVAAAGKDIEETGRTPTASGSLDTRLEALLIGERHPGDVVTIRVRVRGGEPGAEVTLAETRRHFRLRVVGPYMEPRGALFLVDPREAGLSEQSYEPSVGLSYVAHVGIRDAGAWNELLNPGLGFSLILLDFADDKDFELGIALTATLFRDFLFAAYGRNLQVGHDLFSIGVNPLAIDDLLGRSAAGRGTSGLEAP